MRKAAALLMAAALCFACFTGCTGKKQEEGLAAQVVMKSDRFEITGDMFQYYLSDNYKSYCQEYSAYISYILDTSMPLKNQECAIGSTEGMTWFDFFVDQTVLSASMFVTLAEAALEANMELSKEDKAEIEDQLTQIEDIGKEQGYDSIDSFLKDVYGDMVTRKTLEKCFEIHLLASEYYAYLYNGYEYTEEDYENYAKENKEAIYKADYISLKIEADVGEQATEEQTAAACAAALEKAEAIDGAITGEQGFLDQIEDFLRQKYTVVADDTEIAEDAENTITETSLANLVEQSQTTGAAYTADQIGSDWLYSEDRKAGDHTVIEAQGLDYYTVYYIVKPIYRQEYSTVNVRHILLSSDTYGSAQAAKEKAEGLLKELLASEELQTAFEAYVSEYSEDPGSAGTGGLYANVDKGQMTEAFEAWCFDEDRKPGDTGIVETEYGAHVMWLEETGLLSWQATADSALRSADYTAEYETLKEKTSIETNEELLKELPDLVQPAEE